MEQNKQIIFLRHAKSSWSNLQIPDKQRPLNKRGRRDAPQMAHYLRSIVPSLDAIICSSAVRTRETISYFIHEYKLPAENTRYSDELYACSPENFLNEIWQLPDDINTVLMVGHNPTISYIGNHIDNEFMVDIPTCGLIITHSKQQSWSKVNFINLTLGTYLYPKMLFY